MRVLLLLLVCCLYTFLPASYGQTGCSGSVNGVNYNLKPLYDALSGVEVSCVDDKRNTYLYTPCFKAQNTNCTFQYDTTCGLCQMDGRSPPQFHGLGTITSAIFSQRANDSSSGFFLTFDKGGEPLPAPARTSQIEFICNKAIPIGTLVPSDPAEDPPHNYHLKWETSFACPTKGGGGGGDSEGISGGWIFIIILVCCVPVYLIVGVAVQKFYYHSSGMELIPNVGFWLALPGLVRDGNLFIVRKALGLCGRGGYAQV